MSNDSEPHSSSLVELEPMVEADNLSDLGGLAAATTSVATVELARRGESMIECHQGGESCPYCKDKAVARKSNRTREARVQRSTDE